MCSSNLLAICATAVGTSGTDNLEVPTLHKAYVFGLGKGIPIGISMVSGSKSVVMDTCGY